MKILIIDDSQSKVNDIKSCIDGHLVDVAECRNDGLIALISEKYDLLILDMQFPVVNGGDIDRLCGLSVIRELNRKNINIPIIICSGVYTDYTHVDTNNLVKSYIVYDSSVYMKPKIESLIDKIVKRED